MITAQNIHYAVRNHHILRGISLHITPGEILAVIGANGAGKSTLLKTISNQYQPARGIVKLNDRPLNDWDANALAKQRAVLSQNVKLEFSMSALDVVQLGRFPYRQQESQSQSKKVAEWCLKQVHLQDFIHRDINKLSGGEQQRVHFARVLAQIHSKDEAGQTKFLLLDEPTSSLDLAQQHFLLSTLRQLSYRHDIGILIILHDLNLAARYADRIAMLKHGHLLKEGIPREVLQPHIIQKGFGVNAQVVDYQLEGQTYIAIQSHQAISSNFHNSTSIHQ